MCIFVLLTALVLTVNYFNNQNVYLTEYEYANENLPAAFDGYRIAVIADIHNSVYADKFIELLEQAKPDAVLFAGDMIQKPDESLNNVLKIIHALPNDMRIYGIFGNHEASNGYIKRKKISDSLREAGVTMLINSYDNITKDGETIRIIGIEDVPDEFIDDEELQKIRKTINSNVLKDSFNILAYHRADMYPQISDLPIDLILSGHMHGGIIRLPFVGGVIGKQGNLFPKYTSGVYKETSAAMIVSRGCDFNPDKARLFNPPEVVLITLIQD